MDRENLRILIPESMDSESQVSAPEGGLYVAGIYLNPGKRYSAKVVPGGISPSDVLQGFVEYSNEASTNKAGVRRVLVRVDVPYLPATSAEAQSCCCQSAEEARASGIPVVSCHLVLTVPKEVAADAANSPYARRLPDAAVDLLVHAVGSLKRAVEPGDIGGAVPNVGYVGTQAIGDVEMQLVLLTRQTSAGVLNTPYAPYSAFPELIDGTTAVPLTESFVS